MRMLSFKEFKKNGSYIYCDDKNDAKTLHGWLKKNKYEFLRGLDSVSIGSDVKCHNGYGQLKDLLEENWCGKGRNNIYTVDQLEFPKPSKKMTIAEIIDELGYDIEIIK